MRSRTVSTVSSFLLVSAFVLATPALCSAQTSASGRQTQPGVTKDSKSRVVRGRKDGSAAKLGDGEKLRKLKDAADTDGDGVVSDKERKAAFEKVQSRNQRFKAKLDQDRDGKISAEEWRSVSEEWKDFDSELDRSLRSLDGRARAALMKSIDTNGDGQLDDQERAALRERTEQARLEMIAKFDADGDGRLIGDEKRALAEALSAARAKALQERPSEKKDGNKDEPAKADGTPKK